MQAKIREIIQQGVVFWRENQQKIGLLSVLLLVGAISWGAGYLAGQKIDRQPLIIERAVETAGCPNPEAGGQNLSPSGVSGANQASIGTKPASAPCAYVGSKNSNKFYLPTCSYAKRVKPENLVCFQGAEEALKQGRTESKCK